MNTRQEQFAGFSHRWDELDSAVVEGLLEIVLCVLMIAIG